MRINNNIPALNAHRLLSHNTNKSSGVLERLSSGRKINKAADDAAGMAISEKMKAQVRGLKKASQNTLDGISLIQTAEGAMNEVHSMLQRMRELAVQSANGTSTDEDRKAIQDEINQLTSEVNRIANGTEFNTRNILRGNMAPNSNTTVHRMSTGAPATFTSSKPFDNATGEFTIDAVPGNGATLTINGFVFGFQAGGTPAVGDFTIDTTANNTPALVRNAIVTQTALINGVDITDGGAANKFVVTSQDFDKNIIVQSSSAASFAEITANNTPVIIGDIPALGNLTSQQLSIWVDGKERIVNLNKLDGTAQNATTTSLLEAFNNALGDLGDAVWTDAGRIEFRTTSIGGASEVKITGTDNILNAIFGTTVADNLIVRGEAERDTGNAVGCFYFNDVPEIGSTLTIGNEKIEFYDSRIGPYTGSNRPINLADGQNSKTIESLVSELSGLGFTGVDLDVDPDVPQRLIVTADAEGFKGQAIFIEGTPKEFITNLQIGPNQGQGFRLSIGDIRATKLGISWTTPEGNTGVKGSAFRSVIEVTNGLSEGVIEYALDVSTEDRATAAITVYDNAILKVAQLRGALGAIQNRLEYTAANLDNTTENLTAALSRIEDADMALEMSEFTKLNILMQSGTAMLAQANQRPQSILQLIGG